MKLNRRAWGGFLLVLLVFSLMGPSSFLSLLNFKTVLTQMVIIAFGALGMTVLIAGKELDLSVGSQMALGTVVTALMLNSSWGAVSSDGLSFLWVFLSGLSGIVVCVLASSILGALVGGWGWSSFLASLGLMQIFRGLAKALAHETTVVTPENFWPQLMLVEPEPSWAFFSWGFWLLIVFSLALGFFLRSTVYGRWVYAIGSNEKAAVVCGLPVRALKFSFFVVSGFFVGIASLLQYSTLTVGDPTSSYGYELDVIAAVVLGGASLQGGQGTVTGTWIGALTMALLRNGCNMLGVASYLQEILVGFVLLIILALDHGLGSRIKISVPWPGRD